MSISATDHGYTTSARITCHLSLLSAQIVSCSKQPWISRLGDTIQTLQQGTSCQVLVVLLCLRVGRQVLGFWDYSSLTRDWAWAPGSESTDSYMLDCQGIPAHVSLITLDPSDLRWSRSQIWFYWNLNLEFPSTKFLLWYHHLYHLLTALLAIMLSHSVFSEQWTRFTVMLACKFWRWNCWGRVAECEASILLVWPCRCDMAPESTILAAGSWSQVVLIAITVFQEEHFFRNGFFNSRWWLRLCDGQDGMIPEPEPWRADSWFSTFQIDVSFHFPCQDRCPWSPSLGTRLMCVSLIISVNNYLY